MKISGIVCEYNPFHNGHLYHIAETRKNGATHIAAVMSGNFVQRGEPAVLDKFTRAGLAVKCGADLVIELPVARCLSSAEGFAAGAVGLLDSLGCVEELSFGSECGDTEKLRTAGKKAEAAAESEELFRLIKQGDTYPKALCRLLDREASEIISQPNNLLAVEYIRALERLNSGIKPFTVRRHGASHDSGEAAGDIASASYIRQHPESAEMYMPEICRNAMKNGRADIKRLETAILYKIRTASPEEIAGIADAKTVAERLTGNPAASLEELLESVKSKNCTMARVKRVIMSLLIGIKRADTAMKPPYIRVLAFNERGAEILGIAKKTAKIPVGTSLAKLSRTSPDGKRFAELEARAGDIYSLAKEEITPAGEDYRFGVKIDLE
ncbi:MAG: nucleotidyltransferase family protein [Ruminococcus sp.]|nr:nucleotidyltransferase family protein [Ruminococcus sp.]